MASQVAVVTGSDDLTVLCVDPGTAARDRIVEAFEGRGEFCSVTADDVAELSTVEAFDRPSELMMRHLDIEVASVGLLDEAEERCLACHGADWETLPLEPVSAGTSLLVTGPSLGGTRELVVGLLACQSGEGLVLVTTDVGGSEAIQSLERGGCAYDTARMAVVDCTADSQEDGQRNVHAVSDPGDLTGIGIAFSSLYEQLYEGGSSGSERDCTPSHRF